MPTTPITASIDGLADALTLRLYRGHDSESYEGRREGPDRWVIGTQIRVRDPLPSLHRRGLRGALGGELAGGKGRQGEPGKVWRVVTLRSSPEGLQGVVTQDGREIARLSLRRSFPARRALVVLCPSLRPAESRAFRAYGLQVLAWYRAHGYAEGVPFSSEDYGGLSAQLEAAARQGRPFSRLVIIGHGGWDGPMIGDDSVTSHLQASGRMREGEFKRFAAALRAGLTPDGMVFASSCHAAGSNVNERAAWPDIRYSWVRDLAARTGRTVAGPAGPTSTEYTLQHVLAVCEGIGRTRQEVHVASPAGQRVIRPGGSLETAVVTGP